MPCSSGHFRVSVGLFYPTFIRILEKKVFQSRHGPNLYSPFVEQTRCTDLSYWCAVFTACCAMLLLCTKPVVCAADNCWCADTLYGWFGGCLQHGSHSYMDVSLHLRTMTDISELTGSAIVHCDGLLLMCGDVESNPGPRQSSLRQTRLTTSTARPTAPAAASTLDHSIPYPKTFEGVEAMMRDLFPASAGRTSPSPPTLTGPTVTVPDPATQDTASTAADLTSVLSSLNSKFDDLKDDLAKLTNVCTSIQKEMSDLRSEINILKSENNEVKKENDVLKEKVQTLEKRTEGLESQCKQNNLIFYGINRGEKESVADCEQAVRKVMADNLQLSEDMVIDKVRRVNRKADSPIVVTLPRQHQREAVLKAKGKLKGTNIFISKDYTVRVQKIRKELVPLLKDAREAGKRAVMVHDHLLVDGVKMYLD